MFTKEEIEDIIRQVEADMPRLREVERKQLAYFQQLCPDRCGKIDLEKGEVIYNNEKYTIDYGNHIIELIEDYLRIYNFVGLDYELRRANLYDPSGAFQIKIPDTEEEKRKYRIASELHFLYSDYYRKLLKENGMNIMSMREYRYLLPWTGCEKEINPDKYAESLLLTEKEVMEILETLYPEAYKKATRAKGIQEFEFKPIMTETGQKKLCKARLDKERFEVCKKEGFHLLSVNIPAEKFANPIREEVQDGRVVYCFEFMMDEG